MVFSIVISYYGQALKTLRTMLKIPMEMDQIASSVKFYLLPYILDITNRQSYSLLLPKLYCFMLNYELN